LKHIILNNNKKAYFASDFHLGAPNKTESRIREDQIIGWLDHIKKDAQVIFLVGDIFDFWYEYRKVIPKGFIRIQGKIAELVDQGIEVYFFLGNHDMWMKNYFIEEIGVQMVENEIKIKINDHSFFIAHGDGLGPGDVGYKFIKKVFRNRVCQFLFALVHPSLGISIANYFSKSSRSYNGKSDEKYLTKENEWLYLFCKDYLNIEHMDYFIFGHRHLPMEIGLKKGAKYLNLGEWINFRTYVTYDGETAYLSEWKEGTSLPFKGIVDL